MLGENSSDCAHVEDHPHCQEAIGCVEQKCETNNDCMNNKKSQCNNGLCVECNLNDDCKHINAELKCISGSGCRAGKCNI